ncbi:hypothetical protein [Methylobacterium sp. 37f]|uniref:hypothetical protein n=1 Tax=Methylobacterium sp. 37f TaxID=2817058 RepID=UPI001FFDDAE1|nr:hypothetical protein [Methylobacterium sp. 37f]MCK2056863.1 hypothetical protein [Methylobacterium sp. 37f]
MSETTNTYPYTLKVEPKTRREGIWQWVVRKHGKLLNRSDRDHPSEAKARAQGMEEIERMLRAAANGHPRR